MSKLCHSISENSLHVRVDPSSKCFSCHWSEFCPLRIIDLHCLESIRQTLLLLNLLQLTEDLIVDSRYLLLDVVTNLEDHHAAQVLAGQIPHLVFVFVHESIVNVLCRHVFYPEVGDLIGVFLWQIEVDYQFEMVFVFALGV